MSLTIIPIILGVVIMLSVMRPPRRACPNCRAPLPRTRRPRNLLQALRGGWTCARCGAELDRVGQKVAA